MRIMDCLVSTTATAEEGLDVQKFAMFLQCREFSANSKVLMHVDCSMEECQDESSSKGVFLDVHYI
mgnify:CR=1 FL=1